MFAKYRLLRIARQTTLLKARNYELKKKLDLGIEGQTDLRTYMDNVKELARLASKRRKIEVKL